MPALPRSFSVSAAGTWSQCPRRWRFRYIEKRADPPGEPALLGTFVHRVLELLCAEPADSRDLDRARSLATEAWPETAEDPDYVALGHDANAQRQFKWRGWTAIQALWQIEDPADVEVRATEAKVEATVGGVPFFGVVDRLDVEAEGLAVTDYKTGKAPRPGDVPKSLDQVLLYAAAVEDHLGERPAKARLYYLGSGVHQAEVTDGGLDGAVERFAEAWAGVGRACANDDFPPDTGPLCGWCPYVADCPEGGAEVRNRAARGRLRDDAPARVLLGLPT